MKYRITFKRYHASSVRLNASGYIFTFSGRSSSPSLHPGTDFTKELLCQPREEPNATPFELDALLLLLLPLLFTLQKLDEEEATGERSHQLVALPQQRTSNLQSLTYRFYCGRSLYRARSLLMTAFTRRISESTMSIQYFRVSISIPNSSCATSSCEIMLCSSAPA